jgi:hypothetical protein
MIRLHHVELTTPEGTAPYGEDGTLLRYWQAEVPDTDLFAMTEEACTRMDTERHMRFTRFFVGTQPAGGHGIPFGGILAQDELHHGDHFPGPIGSAIRELDGPTPWTDDARQRMLEEAIVYRAEQLSNA